MKLPKSITDNLNPSFADAVFKLLNKILDIRINDDNMFKFKTRLNEYDGNFKNQDERDKAIDALNKAYNLLSILQKKVVLRTVRRAQMNSNIDSYMDLYIKEVDILITKERDNT